MQKVAKSNRICGAVLLMTSLFVIATISLPVEAAKLPKDASKTLNSLKKAKIPVISKIVAKVQKKFSKDASNYYVVKEMKVGKLKATFALYKPKGTKKYLFAAILPNVSLKDLGLDAGPLDQVALKPAIILYSMEKLGSQKVSSWPGALGKTLKGLAPNGSTNLSISDALNVYARLDKGASGETAKLLGKIGLKLSDVTTEVRRDKKKKITVSMMRWGSWEDPFGFKGATFKDVTIRLEKDKKKNSTAQAWGDFVLAKKTYFLWGGQSTGPTRNGRAFGLGAKEITMQSMMDFVDTMPAMSTYKFGSAVSAQLPLDKVTIKNKNYKAYKAGVFPDTKTFTVFYADKGEEVATTGKKGPLFAASGAARIINWDAASLTAKIDPKNGKYYADAKMGTGDIKPLPMSNASFKIDVDKPKKQYAMGFNGSFKIEDITVAAADFNISKTKMNMSVNLGCVPPMLKASIDAKFTTSIPKPKISGSGCGEKIGKEIAAAAKKVGHTIKNATETVGNAIGNLTRSIKGGEKKKKTNSEIPLFQTAARHKMLENTLADMKKTGVSKINMTSIILPNFKIPFDLGATLPKVYASKSSLEKQLKGVDCRADGRISGLLKMKKIMSNPALKSNPAFAAFKNMSKNADAELNFYKPFKDRKSRIEKILNEKPKKKKIKQEMPPLPPLEITVEVYSKEFYKLEDCEKG
jgi:hypothetical protein